MAVRPWQNNLYWFLFWADIPDIGRNSEHLAYKLVIKKTINILAHILEKNLFMVKKISLQNIREVFLVYIYTHII